MHPLIYGILVCVCVTKGFSLSDIESQNVTEFPINIHSGKDSDVLRQLLNQETIIRISMVKNVHLLMQDVVTLKGEMSSVKDMIEALTTESEELKRENKRLNDENLHLKKQIDCVNATLQQQIYAVNSTFANIETDILRLKNEQNKWKNTFEGKRETFERNISGILGDIKIEVRYLSVTLLNLNDHTRELDTSIPERLEENNRLVFDFVNKTLDKLTDDITEYNGRQVELLSSVSDLKVVQDNMSKHITDDLINTVYYLQDNVQQWVQDQTKLSLSVTSLELLHSYEKVGFTVGVPSSSGSWSGSTLLFPKVIYDIGGGYSTSTGIFTSPTDGTFVFYVTVMSARKKHIYVLNGNSMVRTMSWESGNSDIHQTGTNMVVLGIQKGDKVWVKRRTGIGYYSHIVPMITFSGFRIY